MRRVVKWFAGIILGLLLALVLVLQIGFSDPLSAAMSLDKLGGRCQSVDAQGDLWRRVARLLEHGRGPLEWYGALGGEVDASERAELSNTLKAWAANSSSQFALPSPETAETETQDRSCSEGTNYSQAAVRGDLAFVATEHQCGFDCGTGQIVAFRKIGFWWFPSAALDTWIT